MNYISREDYIAEMVGYSRARENSTILSMSNFPYIKASVTLNTIKDKSLHALGTLYPKTDRVRGLK